MFIVAAFFHAISTRAAKSTVLRAAGIVGLTTIATIILQMWGDMGWNTLSPDVLMAASLGVALRLPVLSGAWASKSRRDEERREHPHDAERPERGERLPEPAVAAPLPGVYQGDHDRRDEHAEDVTLPTASYSTTTTSPRLSAKRTAAGSPPAIPSKVNLTRTGFSALRTTKIRSLLA